MDRTQVQRERLEDAARFVRQALAEYDSGKSRTAQTFADAAAYMLTEFSAVSYRYDQDVVCRCPSTNKGHVHGCPVGEVR